MWKGLKRLWSRSGDGPAREPGEDPAWARPPEPAPEPEPERPDPFLEHLHALDRLIQAQGVEAAVPAMRAVLAHAPTDARVLRRAAVVLRGLGDEGLASAFDQAAATSQAEPLVALARGFLTMDDASLALAFADGALVREPGLLVAAHLGGEALARAGRHADVLARLEAMSFRSVSGDAQLATRWATSAIIEGDLDRYARIAPHLPEDAGWLVRAAERAGRFPPPAEASAGVLRQWLVFTLYGGVLLDDVAEGEPLDATRIGRWMHALAAMCRASLDPETRPAWVSPRGEVLARWLGSLLPVRAALPLSARLPKQPVLVVLADDQDLVTLWETKAWFDGPAPVFQAMKDPAELGSPMADVVGVFRAGVELPFAGLEAERAADRLPPRMIATRLEAEAGRIEPAELEGFLAWAEERRDALSLAHAPTAEDRVALTGDTVG